MLCLFIAESEFLLRSPTHFEERTAIKQLMGQLPLYHFFLGFVASAILIRFLAGNRLPQLATEAGLSRRALAFHVAYAGALELMLTPVWQLTRNHSDWGWIWFPILAGFFASWLACLLHPRMWWMTLQRHRTWMLLALCSGIATEMLARVSNSLWDTFSFAALWSTSRLLKLVVPELMVDPQTVTLATPTFSLQVLAGCSGLEGMGLVVCYVALFLWLRRDVLRFPQALWLMPLGLAAIWTANIIRLVALVLVGTYWSPQIAARGFHSQAGWITFTTFAIFALVAVERLGWFRKDRTEHEGARFPALPYVLPLLVLLFTWMVSQALSMGGDRFYPVRILLVAVVLWSLSKSYAPILGPMSPSALAIGLGVYILWVALVEAEPAADPLEGMDSSSAAVWLAFRALGSVIIVPLVEELAFRGYLLRRLQSSIFEDVPVGRVTPASLLVSSLAFGLLHQAWLAGTVAGLAYGMATWKRESLTDAVVAHATTNFCLVFHVLLWQEWSLW